MHQSHVNYELPHLVLNGTAKQGPLAICLIEWFFPVIMVAMPVSRDIPSLERIYDYDIHAIFLIF
jgi:hypothetical protein